MPINKWMDKETVVHIYNGILLSHKRNTFESVLMRWMNLDPITQSGVSQKWKSLSHVWFFVTPWTVQGVCTILQARILEWVDFPFFRGSSQPRDGTQVSHTAVSLHQLSHQGSIKQTNKQTKNCNTSAYVMHSSALSRPFFHVLTYLH